MNRRAWLALVLAVGCRGVDLPPADPPANDPNKPGLAFARVPTSAVLKARFELRVRINDERGRHRAADDATVVTVSASGAGTLGGTLTRTAEDGYVRFDDLVYDRWEAITLTVRAEGLAETTTTPILVRPILRLTEMPPARVAVERPFGPLALELVDGEGALVPGELDVQLEATDPYAIVAGGRVRRLTGGRARYEAVTFQESGPHTVAFRAEGLAELLQGLQVDGDQRTEALWLPPGRVGVPYRATLPTGSPAVTLIEGELPPGLALEGSALVGTPAEARHGRFKLSATDGSVTTTWLVGLSVFPKDERLARPLDELGPGPYAVATLRDRITVRARATSEEVRILHPTGANVPNRRLPVVVFHHGASRIEPGITSLHDRFDHLLGRWVSHGFVAISIDAMSLIYRNGAYTPLTITNLNQMAENIRAAVAYVRARAQDPTFPLAERMDPDRIIVAGHSRGAGAAIIAARSTPRVIAMLLIKPVDPLMAMGGELLWKRALPAKPTLLFVAGNDADVVYPMVDFLYERRAATTSSITILGSVHAFTCDGCPPERGAMPQISREHDWALTNAYSTAFLRYVAHGRLDHAPLLFGEPGLSTRLSPLGVLRRSDRHGVMGRVDDFQDFDPRNALGLPSYTTGPVADMEGPSLTRALEEAGERLGPQHRQMYMSPEVMAFSRARLLRWTGEAAWGTHLGTLDARALGAFVFRARSDAGPLGPGRVRLRFSDTGGRSATFDAAPTPLGIPDRFEDVIIPLPALAAAGLSLDGLAGLEILLAGAGALALDDLRFE